MKPVMMSIVSWDKSYFSALVYSLLLAFVLVCSGDILEFLSRQRGAEIELWMLLFSLFWFFVVVAYSLNLLSVLGLLVSSIPGFVSMHYLGNLEGVYTFNVVALLFLNISAIRWLPEFYRMTLKTVNDTGMCPRDRDLCLVGSLIIFFVLLVSFDYLEIMMIL